MRGILLITTVAVFLAATAFSQQSRYKITYSHSSLAEWARSLHIKEDSSMWISVSYALNVGGYGSAMLDVDLAGNITNHKQCERTNFSFLGVSTGSLFKIDSNYYVGCEVQIPEPNPVNPGDMYAFPGLIKYNLTGDTLWTRYLELDTLLSYKINSSRRTHDGNILLCGSQSTSIPGTHNYLVLKLDTAGGIIWINTYGLTTKDERAVSIEELADSSILVSGMQQYSGSVPFANYKPWILRIDMNGSVINSKYFTMPSMQFGGIIVKPGKTTGYWISGLTDSVISSQDALPTNHLTKLDNNFNILRRTFFNSRWFTQIWDFHELDNGDIVFCGDKEDSLTGNQFGFIARMDSVGNQMWWRTYHEYTGNNNYLSSIRPSPDGGFIACGSTFRLPNGLSQDAWIIKTDSMGCVIQNCALNIDEEALPSKQISIYPNPAVDYLTVETPEGKATRLIVKDVTGQSVFDTDVRKRKTTLDLRTLPSGLYMLYVQLEGGLNVSKFIKQ